MGYGTWTRWGRGSCEGYSLQIGDALRGQVSCGADGQWASSLTNIDLGRHVTKAQARAAVETRIDLEMTKILSDWAFYKARLASLTSKG